MHGHTKATQRREQCLKPIRQTQGARRQCQQCTEQNEQYKAQRDVRPACNPLPCHAQRTDAKDLRTGCHKKMHTKRKQHNPEDRSDRAQLHPERNLGKHHQKGNGSGERKKSCRIFHKENEQQEEKEQHHLHPWIHTMQKRIPGQITANLYIIQQKQSHPYPFSPL